MNRRLFVTCTLIAAFSCSAAPTWAQECTKTFRYTSGFWQYRENWDPFGAPGPTDIACIHAGSYATIVRGVCEGGPNNENLCNPDLNCPCGTCISGFCEGGSAHGYSCDPDVECPGGVCTIQDAAVAGAIKLDGGGYKLEIRTTSTLTLYGRNDQQQPITSTVDGTVRVNQSSALVIANDLTIEGEGGIIEGEFCASPECPARIIGPGKLTIEGENNESQSTSLVLNEQWIIEVELENKGYVNATHASGITLTGAAKSGNGIWMASDEDTTGLLVIDCEVVLEGQDPVPFEIGETVGNGEWIAHGGAAIRLGSNASFSNWTGLIQMSASNGVMELNRLSATTWNFLLTDGTLKVIENFDTSGNLEMTGGKIKVMSGKWAIFD